MVAVGVGDEYLSEVGTGDELTIAHTVSSSLSKMSSSSSMGVVLEAVRLRKSNCASFSARTKVLFDLGFLRAI